MPVLVVSRVGGETRELDYVNGGRYQARANVVGLGLRYDFDWEPKEEEAAGPSGTAREAGAADP